MTRFAAASTLTLTLALAGIAYALSGSSGGTPDLRRVDCKAITMFTPAHGRSAKDLCENYGGVAHKDNTPSSQGLVILVRNQPMGGFKGNDKLN